MPGPPPQPTALPCAADGCLNLRRSNDKYCGMHRARLTRHGDFSKLTLRECECLVCKKRFTKHKHPNAKTCSQKCANALWYREQEHTIACQICGGSVVTRVAATTLCRKCSGITAASGRSGETVCSSCGVVVQVTNPWQKLCEACSYRRRIVRTVKRNARRKALRRGAMGPTHSESDWVRLLARYGGMCAYCGVMPAEHRDHVVPIARGGSDAIGNILPACAHCNLSKAKSLIVEWKKRKAS